MGQRNTSGQGVVYKMVLAEHSEVVELSSTENSSK